MIRLGAELEEIAYEGQPSSVYFGLPMYEKVDLQAILDEAVARGDRELTIPRGAYRVQPKNGAHLSLRNLSDFTLHAEDVVLLCQDLRAMALNIVECHNVTVTGLSIDYEPYGFAQMKITAIDPAGQYLDVSIDRGYVAQFKDNEYGCHEFQNVFFDGVTREMMFLRYYRVTDENVEALGDRRFRVHCPLTTDQMAVLRPGDYLVASMRKVMRQAVNVSSTGGLHMDNIHVYAGMMGLVESSSPEKNYYNHFYDVPGPRPYGATEDRMCATAADGAHMTNNYVGATIENSVFHSLIDDGANFFGRFSMVAEIISPTECVIAELSHLPFKAGEVLRIYTPASELVGDATVVSSERLPAEWTPVVSAERALGVVVFRPKFYHRVTLEHPIELELGCFVNNTAHCSNGFVLRNNIYGNLRPRGALIKASHGLIENCVFENVGRHGVQISPEIHWSEAGYAHDVVVRNNLFVHTGAADGVAITVEGHAARDQRDILIEGNRFVNCPNGDLRLTSCNGVTVRRNTFSAGNRHNIDIPTVNLGTASNVRFEDNTFVDTALVPFGAGGLADGIIGANPTEYFVSSIAMDSKKQGADGWHYGYAPIGSHTYTDYPIFTEYGNRVDGWQGDEEGTARYGTLQRKWNGYMLPGEEYDCVKTFICPKDGRVRLGSPIRVVMAEPTDDGVLLSILHNDQKVWEYDLPRNGVIPSPRLELSVKAGDAIHFRVNKKGNHTNDGVTWNPAVLYLS